MRTAKNQLNFFLFPFIFVLSYPPVQFSGSGILLRKMLKKKSGFSGFEGLISYMHVSYMHGGGVQDGSRSRSKSDGNEQTVDCFA